jgi:hypothetical protein
MPSAGMKSEVYITTLDLCGMSNTSSATPNLFHGTEQGIVSLHTRKTPRVYCKRIIYQPNMRALIQSRQDGNHPREALLSPSSTKEA